MSKYARAVDSNQAEVVAALRAAGVEVTVVSQHAGLGFDLIARKGDTLRFLETKDGRLAPSRRRLTPAEVRAAKDFDLWHRVVLCPEDALVAMGLNARMVR